MFEDVGLSENDKKYSEKEVWNFLDHGFFHENQLEQLETRMVDQGYAKPAMVEDPDPEVEMDDLDEDLDYNAMHQSDDMFHNHENQLLFSSI